MCLYDMSQASERKVILKKSEVEIQKFFASDSKVYFTKTTPISVTYHGIKRITSAMFFASICWNPE